MAYNDSPPPSSDPKIYGQQVARMVIERRELSSEESTDLRRRLPKWYESYRGYRRAKAQPFRNQVHIPLTFAVIESDVAVKASLIANQRPIVEFVPTGPEDTPSARRVTALVDEQLMNARFYAKLLDLLRSADIGGTAVAKYHWRYDEDIRQQRIPAMVSGIPIVQTNKVIDFNGPDFELIDLLDFFPEPGKARLELMRWVVHRYWLDYDEILKMSVPNPLTGVPTFDPAAIDELREVPITDESSSQLEERRINPGAMFTAQHNPERFDKFSKPVEILEMHGYFPNEMVPQDGFPNRLVTIANNRVVLRNVPNPIWSKGLPFLSYSPVPDPYSFYGIGKVEPNEKLQATASRLTSQKLDAMDFLIDPQFVYNRLANVDTRKLYSRPGGLTPVDGNPAEAIMPLIVDMKGVQQSMLEVEQLWRWYQISSGVLEDTVIGAGGAEGDRQTAREFLGRMESSQRRLVFETLGCVDQFVQPLAESFRALNAQFMDFPTQVRIQGVASMLDPVSGAPVPPDIVTIQDVVLKYDMRAQATTSLVGKAAKQQNDAILLPIISQSPILAMITNWPALARMLYRDFDWNPEELILKSPEQIMMNAAAMAVVMQANAQKGGTDTQSGGGEGESAGAPSSLNPDILNQFMQPEGSKPNGGLTAA